MHKNSAVSIYISYAKGIYLPSTQYKIPPPPILPLLLSLNILYCIICADVLVELKCSLIWLVGVARDAALYRVKNSQNLAKDQAVTTHLGASIHQIQFEMCLTRKPLSA